MSTLTEVDFVVKQAVLGLVAKGKPLVVAAKLAGTNKRAIDALLRSDPEFAEDMAEAVELMVGRVDDVVYDHAVDGDVKFVEMFYRRYRPEIMQTAGIRGAGGASAPMMQVAHMSVQIVKALVTGDAAPQWFETLHPRMAAIEATIVDDEPS